MSLRRRSYLVEESNVDYDLENALDKLHQPLVDWVFYNEPSGKKRLFEIYQELTGKEKTALARAVKQAFVRSHGGNEAILYRRMKSGQSVGSVGGKSLSPTVDRSGAKHAQFRVKIDDVFLHYGMPNTALSSKAYGHEKEIILHKKAKPKFLGWVQGGQQ